MIFHAIRKPVAWSDAWKHEPQCFVWYLSGYQTHMNFIHTNISHTQKIYNYDNLPPMSMWLLWQSHSYDNLSHVKISHVWTSFTFVCFSNLNMSWRTIWHLSKFDTYQNLTTVKISPWFNSIHTWSFLANGYLTQLEFCKNLIYTNCHTHLDFTHRYVTHMYISHVRQSDTFEKIIDLIISHMNISHMIVQLPFQVQIYGFHDISSIDFTSTGSETRLLPMATQTGNLTLNPHRCKVCDSDDDHMVYINMFAYIHIYLFSAMHIRFAHNNLYTYAWLYFYEYQHTYACVFMHTCIYIYKFGYMHI